MLNAISSSLGSIFFSIVVLMSVFRAANGHLISTIESKSINPCGDAPKKFFSVYTNKPQELTFKPVISSNFCFAFSSLSIPYCSESDNFFNFEFPTRHKISFIVFAVSVVSFIFIILPKLLAVNLLFLSLSNSSLLRCPIVKIGIDATSHKVNSFKKSYFIF
jgi:hypothetical protein